VCQKFMKLKLRISKNEENVSEQTSGKYALPNTQVSQVKTREKFLSFYSVSGLFGLSF